MAGMHGKAAKLAGAPRFLLVAIGMAAALILAAGGIMGYALHEGPENLSGGVLSSAVGGPFRLIDQNGKPFTDADLQGKWHLVFFGYTHCPDICPTTLNDLSLAYDKLDKQQQKDVSVVFISVDPDRDTPTVLKSYIENFDAPIVGLTGTAAEVQQAAKDYHVYYAKHYLAGGGYDMDHSAVVYVMNPKGRFVATMTPDEAVTEIEAKLEKLVS
ncbi:MAG TPA: SCO family protein [Stellaceae bacterium]|nr:SCO family protein [Stellaceae bacterium]